MVVERVAQVLVLVLEMETKAKAKRILLLLEQNLYRIPQLRGKNLKEGLNLNSKMSQVILGEIRVMRSLEEIRGKDNRFFNHLIKITITRESRMTLMHSTSMKKSKKKQKSSLGVNEYEEEASFDDYEEEGEVSSDPAFNEEFKKQQQDLKRKEGELEKISQVITKKAELLKSENEEKQRLHNLKVQRRKLDVRLKLGDSWDMARRMFGLPHESTNNDREFLQLLDSYKMANPGNSVFMEALRLEILKDCC